MKSLIVYSTKTNNTKKLADTIKANLSGDADLFSVEDAPSAKNYDMVFIGFWLQGGNPDPKTSEYLKTIDKGTRVFLFATHGAKAGSAHAENAMNAAVGLMEDIELAGTFSCQGEVNPVVLEKVKQKPEPPVWIGDADDAVGHPDESDLSALKERITKL